MSVWRLEWLRLFRTARWAGLLASYLVFGIAMPVLTRYQEALFRNLGGEVRIIAPAPTPPQAIAAYLSNAMQIGLLVSVLLSAGSLAFDAKPEWAAFLRTRSTSLWHLVLPKYATNALAVAVSYLAGLVAAWIGTLALIGPTPVNALVAGGTYGALYLGFAVAVVALAAGVARNAIGGGGIALAVLIALPILAQVLPSSEPWLPSTLVGAPTALADGDSPWSFLRPAIATLVATPLLLWSAERLLARREI